MDNGKFGVPEDKVHNKHNKYIDLFNMQTMLLLCAMLHFPRFLLCKKILIKY